MRSLDKQKLLLKITTWIILAAVFSMFFLPSQTQVVWIIAGVLLAILLPWLLVEQFRDSRMLIRYINISEELHRIFVDGGTLSADKVSEYRKALGDIRSSGRYTGAADYYLDAIASR